MIGISISLLWLCIGVIVLGTILWILLSVVQRFFPGAVTENIRYMVFAIFAILILIYALTALTGGGMGHLSFR